MRGKDLSITLIGFGSIIAVALIGTIIAVVTKQDTEARIAEYEARQANANANENANENEGGNENGERNGTRVVFEGEDGNPTTEIRQFDLRGYDFSDAAPFDSCTRYTLPEYLALPPSELDWRTQVVEVVVQAADQVNDSFSRYDEDTESCSMRLNTLEVQDGTRVELPKQWEWITLHARPGYAPQLRMYCGNFMRVVCRAVPPDGMPPWAWLGTDVRIIDKDIHAMD